MHPNFSQQVDYVIKEEGRSGSSTPSKPTSLGSRLKRFRPLAGRGLSYNPVVSYHSWMGAFGFVVLVVGFFWSFFGRFLCLLLPTQFER